MTVRRLTLAQQAVADATVLYLGAPVAIAELPIFATLMNGAGYLERVQIVEVDDRVVWVVRGQQGTLAMAFPEGSLFVFEDGLEVPTPPPPAGLTEEEVRQIAREEGQATSELDWDQVNQKPSTATRWPGWSEVTSKPSTFTPSSHIHNWDQVTGQPATATRWPTWGEVDQRPATATRWPTWSEVENKPAALVNATSAATPNTAAVRNAAGTFKLGEATDPAHPLRRGDILGTVSATGTYPNLVPTGAIIESGSNANGSYVKYADGKMICHLIRSSGTVTFNAGQVRTHVISSWTYPVAFTTTPNLNTTTRSSWIYDFVGSFESANASTASAFHVRNISASSRTLSISASLLAIGRWK